MTEERRAAFEAAYTKWLLDQLVKEEDIPIYLERSKRTGYYHSVQVESAWWGWNSGLDNEKTVSE